MSRKDKRKEKQSKIGICIVILCVLLVGGVVFYVSIDLRAKRDELRVQVTELQAQIENAESEYQELVAREEYMQTKKYVEDVARNQLGLVYPDEIVIRPEE